MKKIIIGLLLTMLLSSLAFSMDSAPEKEIDVTTKASNHIGDDHIKDKSVLSDKIILMIVASKNFRDEEYTVPRNIFEKYGAKVVVASSIKEEIVGVKRTKVIPDILLKDVKVKNYNAFVFVGGPGAKEYFDDSAAHSIASWGFASRKPVAAICIAPVILANSGILGGKKATAHESHTDTLTNEGAIYTGSDVEIYGNIITAKDPKASEKFAMEIVKYLSK